MKHLLLLVSSLAPCWAAAQSFAPPVVYSTGIGTTRPVAVATGDVNGDGRTDVVTANYGGTGTVGVFLNAGGGTLAPVVAYTPSSVAAQFSSPVAVALGDINLDGYLDIVVAASSGTTSLAVLPNLRNGTFGPATLYATPATTQTYDLALGDVNKDGYLDVVIADNGVGIDEVSVLLNLRNGTLGAFSRYSTGSNSGPVKVAVGDLNGDGYPDLVTANNNNSTASVLLNNATGTFAAFTAYATSAMSYPQAVAISDVNKDGYPDVVAVGGATTVAVLLNRNNGTFNPAAAYSAGATSEPRAVAVGDLNADGYPDLVTVNRQAKAVGLLLNQAAGTFPAATALPLGSGPGSYPENVALADLNADGKLDIITADGSANGISVLLNTTTPLATQAPRLTQVQATIFPNPAAGSVMLTATELPAEVQQLAVTFTDVTGRTVAQMALPATHGTVRALLPVAALPAGYYLLRLSALDAQHTAIGTLPVQRLSIW